MKYDIPTDATIISIDGDHVRKAGIWCSDRGLKIETDKGDVVLLIDDYQACCESWDALFLETPDDITKYIGATILEVSDTNDRPIYSYYDAGGETQLKIVTNRGVLQYAVYNDHNGYYSHSTFLQVFDHEEEGGL